VPLSLPCKLGVPNCQPGLLNVVKTKKKGNLGEEEEKDKCRRTRREEKVENVDKTLLTVDVASRALL
jgi:hypothetical protein